MADFSCVDGRRRMIGHPNTGKPKEYAIENRLTECESVNPRYLEKKPNH